MTADEGECDLLIVTFFIVSNHPVLNNIIAEFL